jgi:hypothetical protein
MIKSDLFQIVGNALSVVIALTSGPRSDMQSIGRRAHAGGRHSRQRNQEEERMTPGRSLHPSFVS